MTVITQATSCCVPRGLDSDVTGAPPPRSSTSRISVSRMFPLLDDGALQEPNNKRVSKGFENSSGVLNRGRSNSSVLARLPSRRPCFLKNESYLRQCKEYLEQNSEGDTHLHVAIVQQLPLLVRDLVSKVPHPRYLDIKNDDSQAPLHVAVITRQADVIVWLLDAGADTTTRDRRGNTALHLACQMGEVGCVKALTRSNQLRDVKDLLKSWSLEEPKAFASPCHGPCRMLDVSIVKEVKTQVPTKPCQNMEDLKSIKTLAAPSLKQTTTKARGNPCQLRKQPQKLEIKVPTALYQTADVMSAKSVATLSQKRDMMCIEEFKNEWFEINEEDLFPGKLGSSNWDETCCLITPPRAPSTLRRGEISPEELADALLSVVNSEGETCAHVAANHGHLEVLKLLVRGGVDLNAREGRSGNTVLHIAVERGIDHVSRYLLEGDGCRLEIRNYAGKTAYDLARDINPGLAEEMARRGSVSIAKKREKKVLRQSVKNATRKGKS